MLLLSGFLIFFLCFRNDSPLENIYTHLPLWVNTVDLLEYFSFHLFHLYILFYRSIIISTIELVTIIYLLLFLLIVCLYKWKSKRSFKTFCHIILEDIKKDLKDKMEQVMSENEIIDKYPKKYDIGRNTFINKHLKELFFNSIFFVIIRSKRVI